jgi:hypothetical protein
MTAICLASVQPVSAYDCTLCTCADVSRWMPEGAVLVLLLLVFVIGAQQVDC